MSWADNVRIETPEQIDVDLEIAGPGSRFFAQATDWFIKWLVVFLAFLLFMIAMAGAGEMGTSAMSNYLLLGLAVLAGFVFFFGYDIYYEGHRNGQTPGKYWAGIRVVRDGGGPIDVQAACIRNLVGIADFLPFGYLLGGLVSLMNARGQRLGDMAAGSIVIRERPMTVHEDLENRILARAGADILFTPDQLGRCTPNDRHILESFFARSGNMERDARFELATKLRDLFLERTGYVATEPVRGPEPTEAFLAALYRDLKALHQHS
jgi:uncharacterized RDD family membrane protein YckC